MGFGTFIRSNLLPVSLAFASFALIAFVLATTGVGWPVIVLVCGIGVGCALTALVASFLARREFYRDLARMTDEGANPLWFNELMERPDVAEDALAFDALRAMAKAASDEVAGARRYVVDYREYVETWVHEAKSPLAAAHLMVEDLRGEGGLDEGARARLDTLDEELDRTEGYIEQALFYARSETLDRDYLIRSYALSDLVASAVKANARELIAAGAAPVLHDLDQRVFTDEKWMTFILGQVVQNSIKYARTEGRVSSSRPGCSMRGRLKSAWCCACPTTGAAWARPICRACSTRALPGRRAVPERPVIRASAQRALDSTW